MSEVYVLSNESLSWKEGIMRAIRVAEQRAVM